MAVHRASGAQMRMIHFNLTSKTGTASLKVSIIRAVFSIVAVKDGSDEKTIDKESVSVTVFFFFSHFKMRDLYSHNVARF